jgi:hypothetical protein
MPRLPRQACAPQRRQDITAALGVQNPHGAGKEAAVTAHEGQALTVGAEADAIDVNVA